MAPSAAGADFITLEHGGHQRKVSSLWPVSRGMRRELRLCRSQAIVRSHCTSIQRMTHPVCVGVYRIT